MKSTKWMVLVVGVLFLSTWAQAATFGPVSVDEGAQHGAATHVAVISYSDLSETSTNTAQAITNLVNVSAKQGVELVAMVLESAFDTGETNYTGSTLLKVGDGTDDDLYLTSTELASDGTEVWLKFPPVNAGSISITPQTITFTNVFGASTNIYTVATNAVATFAGSALGSKVYTADDTVDFSFTPNSQEALSALISGKVRIYFRIWDAQ